MAITNIAQTILSFVQKHISHPFASIPTIMILCSTIKRGGLSPLQISGRILNRFGENGMLIDVNIDGSPNLMNQAVYIIVDEIVKAIKLDSKVVVAVPPGAITSTGVSPSGPVTVVNQPFQAEGITI